MINPQNIQAKISLQSYVKINLHAAKHPGMCLGYLLGEAQLAAEGKSTGANIARELDNHSHAGGLKIVSHGGRQK